MFERSVPDQGQRSRGQQGRARARGMVASEIAPHLACQAMRPRSRFGLREHGTSEHRPGKAAGAAPRGPRQALISTAASPSRSCSHPRGSRPRPPPAAPSRPGSGPRPRGRQASHASRGAPLGSRGAAVPASRHHLSNEARACRPHRSRHARSTAFASQARSRASQPLQRLRALASRARRCHRGREKAADASGRIWPGPCSGAVHVARPLRTTCHHSAP